MNAIIRQQWAVFVFDGSADTIPAHVVFTVTKKLADSLAWNAVHFGSAFPNAHEAPTRLWGRAAVAKVYTRVEKKGGKP